jgi:iron complex transport system ATP-binding protein
MKAISVARGLACGYPDRLVLKDIDLELKEGEVLALIGPNGSGKTTLFRTLSGELKPLGGEALLESPQGLREAQSLSRMERARIVARVLQTEWPSWPASVRSYVEAGTFARTGWFAAAGTEERRAVDEALAAADLNELAPRPVTELSGGEFRRVLIARALAQEPRLLLLDEPAADLDLGRQMDILGLLRGFAAEGRAVALSVHDLNLAALVADRVALLSHGALAALGPPREVITAEAIGRAYGATVLVADHPLGDLPQVIHAPTWLIRGNKD